MRSSAIFLVRVVTSTRWSCSTRALISPMRSSIWPLVGSHHDLGVDQAGGAHDLLDDLIGVLELVGRRAWPRGTRTGRCAP